MEETKVLATLIPAVSEYQSCDHVENVTHIVNPPSASSINSSGNQGRTPLPSTTPLRFGYDVPQGGEAITTQTNLCFEIGL